MPPTTSASGSGTTKQMAATTMQKHETTIANRLVDLEEYVEWVDNVRAMVDGQIASPESVEDLTETLTRAKGAYEELRQAASALIHTEKKAVAEQNWIRGKDIYFKVQVSGNTVQTAYKNWLAEKERENREEQEARRTPRRESESGPPSHINRRQKAEDYLKPDKLTEAHTPIEFTHWRKKFVAWFDSGDFQQLQLGDPQSKALKSFCVRVAGNDGYTYLTLGYKALRYTYVSATP